MVYDGSYASYYFIVFVSQEEMDKKGKGALGCYVMGEKAIYISEESLKGTGASAANTVAHEMVHVQQWEIANGPNSEQQKKYWDAYHNQADPDLEPEKYLENPIEKDAHAAGNSVSDAVEAGNANAEAYKKYTKERAEYEEDLANIQAIKDPKNREEQMVYSNLWKNKLDKLTEQFKKYEETGRWI